LDLEQPGKRTCHTTTHPVLVIFPRAPEKFPGEEDQSSSDHAQERLSRDAVFSNGILAAALRCGADLSHQEPMAGIKGSRIMYWSKGYPLVNKHSY